ncbi:MAG: hypothetical protein R2747_22585 [Pyrinomonadaceae bacterium]
MQQIFISVDGVEGDSGNVRHPGTIEVSDLWFNVVDKRPRFSIGSIGIWWSGHQFKQVFFSLTGRINTQLLKKALRGERFSEILVIIDQLNEKGDFLYLMAACRLMDCFVLKVEKTNQSFTFWVVYEYITQKSTWVEL